MSESFSLYVTCNRLDRRDEDAVRRLLDEHGVDVVETHEFNREITYVSDEFADVAANHELVEALTSDIREAVDEDDIKRDKKNMSPQAPGIEGVSYVTGIIIGVSDD